MRLFATELNHSVSFADAILSDHGLKLRGQQQHRSRRSSAFLEKQLSADPDHDWPLMRFFNAETGMEGATYKAKTTELLCEELSIRYFYMLDFVEEAAQTSLCYADGTNCDDRSLRYLRDCRERGNYQADLENLQQEVVLGSHDPWLWRRQNMLETLMAELGTAEEL